MPSHADEDENKRAKLPDWCTKYHIYGNKQADRLADLAAAYAQVPRQDAKSIVTVVANARRIQLRAATIMCNLPHRPRLDIPKPPPPPKVTMDDLMSVTMHTVRVDNVHNRLTCIICGGSAPARTSHAKKWLMTSCVTPTRSLAPVRFPLQLQVAHQVTHVTHKLYNMRGIVFCMNCGGTCGKLLKRNMVERCLNIDNGGKRTAHGQRIISQLTEGNLPRHILLTYGGWPAEITPQLPSAS